MPVYPLRPRPKFARWIFDRGLDYRVLAGPLRSSHETIRRICLPFDDPGRRVPQRALMERIIELTEGEIAPGDFYEVRSVRRARAA